MFADVTPSETLQSVQHPLPDDATLFRSIFERAAMAISVVDDDGIIVEVNGAFEQFVGYDRDEMIGRLASDFSPPEDAPIAREAAEAVRAGLARISVEKRFVRRDGSSWLASLSISRVMLEGGRLGFVVIHDSVTEGARAHAALLESKTRHRELLDTLPLIVYLVEPNPPFTPIYVSGGVSLLGYSHDEWMANAESWTRALHHDDRARVMAETEAAMLERRAVEYEYRLFGKDGSVHWVHDRGEFIYDGTGAPVAWRGIMLDMTARRAAEDALAHERGFLAAVLDSLSESIVACDRMGNLTLFNRATRELHGLPADGFVSPDAWGANFNTYRADGHPEAGTPMPLRELPLFRALAAREAVHDIEYQLAAAGRPPRTMVANARVIRGADGEFLGAVSASRDMTGQKAVERALRESEARVRGAVEASLDALLIARAVRDAHGTIVDFVCIDANARASAIVDIGGRSLVGSAVTELFPVMLPVFRDVLEKGKPFEAEVDTTGHAIVAPWIRLQVVPVSDGIGITARDITEKKRAEATLRALALVDELTGVHNRRGFMALAEREWQRATRESRGAVLAYIDLNDFKDINDLHGHAEGDRALQNMAEVLRAAFRGADVIGRLGGDEFAVLVVPTGPGLVRNEEIHDVERRILGRIKYHLELSNTALRAAGRPYDVRMSIGTAVVASVDGAGGPVSLASLMVMADERLYEQKRARKIAA